jgi:3-oxoacyl-[acyl-carrier protein] reductase
MTQDLAGKSAIVTGGSRGIGRAIALGLASRGASVAVGYLKNDQLAKETVTTIHEQGGTAIAIQADLSQPIEVTALFDQAEKTLGPLDIVFANAADALSKPFIEYTEDDYERIFGTNAKVLFLRYKKPRVESGTVDASSQRPPVEQKCCSPNSPSTWVARAPSSSSSECYLAN